MRRHEDHVTAAGLGRFDDAQIRRRMHARLARAFDTRAARGLLDFLQMLARLALAAILKVHGWFDHYFGQLPAYWQANGYPQASAPFDGLPADASNPAYNGTTTPGTQTVQAFHLATECIENLSPSWDEAHEDWNIQFPTSSTAMMNGFVYNAAAFAIHSNAAGLRRWLETTKGDAHGHPH